VFRTRRRTVVTVTAVVAVLLAGALAVTFLTESKTNTASAGNSVEYQAATGRRRPTSPPPR
jgi:hypothetical protein